MKMKIILVCIKAVTSIKFSKLEFHVTNYFIIYLLRYFVRIVKIFINISLNATITRHKKR